MTFERRRQHDMRESLQRALLILVAALVCSVLTAVPIVRWMADEERGCGAGLFDTGEVFVSCGGSALFSGFYCETGPIECFQTGGGR